MSTDWPEASERRKTAAELIDDPDYLEAYWPLPALPAQMGTIAEAERIPGDPSQRYFAYVDIGFFEDCVKLLGQWEPGEEDAELEVELSYAELAHLMGDDVLRLYREVTLPTGATRRVAGFLRVGERRSAHS